ncbi:MAG: hypothetical protein JOY78_02235 [Pseudonocardia sp.]|nr:hypothetical protein [Pseudonocardia sp.]
MPARSTVREGPVGGHACPVCYRVQRLGALAIAWRAGSVHGLRILTLTSTPRPIRPEPPVETVGRAVTAVTVGPILASVPDNSAWSRRPAWACCAAGRDGGTSSVEAWPSRVVDGHGVPPA